MSLSGPSRLFAAARQFGLFGVKLVGWVEPTGPARSSRPDDRLREIHHLPLCYAHAVTNYRRNFICGGSFFFAANLAERRLRLLVDKSFRRKMMGFATAQPILRASECLTAAMRQIAALRADIVIGRKKAIRRHVVLVRRPFALSPVELSCQKTDWPDGH